MKMIATACFGLALAISAFALAGTSASAFEAAAIAVTAPNDVIKDRNEYREHENRELRERAERKASEGGKRWNMLAMSAVNVTVIEATGSANALKGVVAEDKTPQQPVNCDAGRICGFFFVPPG